MRWANKVWWSGQNLGARGLAQGLPQGHRDPAAQRGGSGRHRLQGLPVLDQRIPDRRRAGRERQRGGHPDASSWKTRAGSWTPTLPSLKSQRSSFLKRPSCPVRPICWRPGRRGSRPAAPTGRCCCMRWHAPQKTSACCSGYRSASATPTCSRCGTGCSARSRTCGWLARSARKTWSSTSTSRTPCARRRLRPLRTAFWTAPRAPRTPARTARHPSR